MKFRLSILLVCFVLAGCEKQRAKQEEDNRFDTMVNVLKQTPDFGLIREQWVVAASLNGCNAQEQNCSSILISGLKFYDTIPIPNAEVLNRLQRSLISQILNPGDPTVELQVVANEYVHSVPAGTKRRLRVTQVEKLKFSTALLIQDSLFWSGQWKMTPYYRSVALNSASIVELHHIIKIEKLGLLIEKMQKYGAKIFPSGTSIVPTQNFYLSQKGLAFCYVIENQTRFLILPYSEMKPLLSRNGTVLVID